LTTLVRLAFCEPFIFGVLRDHESFGWLFHDAIPDFAYLTFTQNVFMGLNETFGGNFLGITWSLAVEEQFYLMIPIVLVLVGLKRFLPVVILLALCAPFLRLAVPSYDAIVHMPCRMDALFVWSTSIATSEEYGSCFQCYFSEWR